MPRHSRHVDGAFIYTTIHPKRSLVERRRRLVIISRIAHTRVKRCVLSRRVTPLQLETQSDLLHKRDWQIITHFRERSEYLAMQQNRTISRWHERSSEITWSLPNFDYADGYSDMYLDDKEYPEVELLPV